MAKQREDFSEPPGARGLTARKQGGLLPVSLAGDVWSGVRRLWDLLASERRCPACASVYAFGDQKETLFCPECSLALTRREKGHCPDCGEPAAWPDLPLAPCLRCLEHPPPWDKFLFHGLHQGLLRQLLLGLKFHGQVALAHSLGRLLAGHPDLAGLSVDCVVPVPLHMHRLARRGYNQALELAVPLAVRLKLPCEPRLLERVRATVSQTGTSLAARKQNTWGAFAATSGVRGARILLLDDTVTTGSTLAAATAALLDAGAGGVSVVAVSRTARWFRGR